MDQRRKPIKVTASLDVWPSVSLTIEPGVIGRFNRDTDLDIYGEPGGLAHTPCSTISHSLKHTRNVIGPFGGDLGFYFPIRNNRGGVTVIYFD